MSYLQWSCSVLCRGIPLDITHAHEMDGVSYHVMARQLVSSQDICQE